MCFDIQYMHIGLHTYTDKQTHNRNKPTHPHRTDGVSPNFKLCDWRDNYHPERSQIGKVTTEPKRTTTERETQSAGDDKFGGVKREGEKCCLYLDKEKSLGNRLKRSVCDKGKSQREG